MLYTGYWGLDFLPFGNDTRPETFIPTHSATLAIAKLRYSLGMGMGASALYGEPGVGKSRVARILMAEFTAARWLTAYLPTPSAGPREILAALQPEGVPLPPGGVSGLKELQDFLLERARYNQPVLLIADDIQAARGSDFLELLRTLLNLEHDGLKALSILLVGQATMERRLESASRFDSQLLIRAVLEPLSDEETRLYVLSKLKAAGSKQGIFTKHAAELVVKFSKGYPRQINRLCEMSLVIAFGLDEKRISPEIVEMAAADLDLLPLGEASFFHWPHPAPAAVIPAEPEIPEEPEEDDILANLSVAETAGK